MNIIYVMNVKMGDRSDCTLVLALLMDKTVVNFKREVETALGKRERGKTNIIICFYSRPCTNLILKQVKKKLHEEENGNGEGSLSVLEDLTSMDYNLKRRARKQMDNVFKVKKKCRFHRGK